VPRSCFIGNCWDARSGSRDRVEPTNPGESAAYVRSRDRGSQLSALASSQSRTIESREALEQRVSELAAQYESADLPLPNAWGGFRLMPDMFEFWQHRDDRPP